jgi:hypothetical protein
LVQCWDSPRGFRRVWLVLAAGPVLAAGFLVLTYLLAPTSPPDDCSDCGEFYGRWMDGVVLIVALFNLVGYMVGAFVGAGLRRSRQERPA